MSIQIQQTVYEPVPTGTYTAEIRDLTAEVGQYGEQVKIHFEIVDGQHAGTALVGWAGKSFSRESKLYKWTKAAFGGADIPPDYNFRSDDLVGRRVRLEVVVRTKPDGSEYSKIEELRPYRKPAARPMQEELYPETVSDVENDEVPF